MLFYKEIYLSLNLTLMKININIYIEHNELYIKQFIFLWKI